ncbi:hypothetical protein EYF80_039270 [Liparis tanakae]|uniref:Uncharacterized protein n=1 Tax=Liparis tanakae TaxID=230148 RepID=A0A4Z2GBD4_9TELE|nr:hypothetical protein EYF80_039270 [Liparis tanakae]
MPSCRETDRDSESERSEAGGPFEKIVKEMPDSCRYFLHPHIHGVHPLTPSTNISINQSTA